MRSSALPALQADVAVRAYLARPVAVESRYSGDEGAYGCGVRGCGAEGGIYHWGGDCFGMFILYILSNVPML